MNVIIANKYSAMLQELNVDIIKSLNGEFEVDEIISTFQNFYFQRMILDITALKNYKDVKVLQKLTIALDMEKVILLLDDSVESSSTGYLSKLISIGIYNFTKNVEGIMYLYDHPNTYRDVAHIHQLEIEKESKEEDVDTYNRGKGTIIIGVKNLTRNAGATTLIYMMKQILAKNYSVVGIEVDKRDFLYFNDKDLVSTVSNNIGNEIVKYIDKEIAFIDVNSSKQAESVCNEIICLVEPSIIKLNKLMLLDRQIFAKMKKAGNYIVLNKSLLSSKDVLEFEYEAKSKVFYNLPPLDDRERNMTALSRFLIKLGFEAELDDEEKKKNGILGLF
jgi:hypothetical protein